MPQRYFGALCNYNATYSEMLGKSKSNYAEKIVNERTNNSERTR
jgi:hypothetical protein